MYVLAPWAGMYYMRAAIIEEMTPELLHKFWDLSRENNPGSLIVGLFV
tara:strand:+ start:293 stop:436 length:144 start_codon:yes stop_codon:yes gene_type:complete